MPLIEHMLEGAALVARQAATSAIAAATPPTTGTAASAPTSGATAGASTAMTTTGVPEPSGTSSTTSATTTSGSGSGSGGGGSSPLLFFVALGFGVVFTNLWIIVGVKYCFRYNARARQLRLAAEEGGEPINLENMPHPRRRRREKKLMTIDEVNEKFPMLKYKTWVASRAKEGLPTRGGIDVSSRPNSVRSAEGVIAPVTESQQRASTDEPEEVKDRPATSTAAAETTADDTTPDAVASGAASTSALPDSPHQPEPSLNARASLASADGDAPELGVYTKDAMNRTSDEHDNHSDDEEDEHIDPALPPECVGTSGDTCAICIDTLEDDDDVRGLTCGHAFHAVCLDPWLTSRRACCPLCKADYYTPKPRVPPAEGADANAQGPIAAALAANGDGRQNRINMPARPNNAWRSMREPSRILPTRFVLGPRNANARNAPPNAPPGEAASAGAAAAPGVSDLPPQPPAEQQQPAASHGNWIGNLRPFRRRQGESSQQASLPAGNPAAAAAPEVTPSQLEAGVRN